VVAHVLYSEASIRCLGRRTLVGRVPLRAHSIRMGDTPTLRRRHGYIREKPSSCGHMERSFTMTMPSSRGGSGLSLLRRVSSA
jgi:hypothetical protein